MTSTSSAPRMADPTPQVRAELIATRRVGGYQHLTFVAPGVAERARPGQFVALATGGEVSAHTLQRCLFVHRVSASGTYGGTVDVVLSVQGVGTRWLHGLRAHDVVPMVGPLGRALPLPAEPVPCVLVGEDYGTAPLLWLARGLRERGCPLEMVVSAPQAGEPFGLVEARRSSDRVTVSAPAGVPDAVAEAIGRQGAGVVYGAGPTPLLQAVTTAAHAGGAVAQVLLEQPMPCGTGLCQACTVPVSGRDGILRSVRACVEGPVFRGDRIRWDRLASAGAAP